MTSLGKLDGRDGLRLALAGATGALGREVLTVLAERRFPVRSLWPFATNQSEGRDIEFQGESISVECEQPRMADIDLMIVCTPVEPALEIVRSALRSQVFCIDCSGALAGSDEVPLFASGLCPPSAVAGSPLVTTPAGPALAWSLVLAPLARAVGVRRVVGTLLQSASLAGRQGIDALSGETVALLNQHEIPEPNIFPSQVAFDCIPGVAGVGEDEDDDAGGGATRVEQRLARDVRRLIGSELLIAVTAVQVPTFVGDGASLAIETEAPVSREEAEEIFAKAPGVELWPQDTVGPTLRDTAGCERVLVGRVRSDPSRGPDEHGLLLWLAGDSLRIAAANAVKLAETRLRLN